MPGTTAKKYSCNDPFCALEETETFNIGDLTTGVWSVGDWAADAAERVREQSYSVYVDRTPPTIETPSWEGDTFGDGAHVLSFSAKDGSASAPQSGVRLLDLYVDGQYVEKALTGCPKPEEAYVIPSESCEGLTGNWTLNGEDYGAGPHNVTVRAEDWVGNVSEKTFHITINHPVNQAEQVGPGSVNLRSGAYELSTTDVSLPAGAANLGVAQFYNSESKEAPGPLGPGWSLSTPDTAAAGQWESLEPLSTGSVEATTTDGGQKVLFTPNESGYTSPVGFQTYTLTETSKSPATYRITDSGGDYTEFTEPSGATTFMPTAVAQTSGGLNKVTYIMKEGLTSEIDGPVAAGESCSGTRSAGCRVLTLKYDTKETTAKGENPTEWGEYLGRLASVTFTAGTGTPITVADYAYDKQGRLRAEWDPRVLESSDCGGACSALKTTYGYDAEGHLTSLTPAGEQPWAFTYGTIAGDATTGRLIKVTRAHPPAGADKEEITKALSEQAEGEKNTEAPKITGSPVVGVRLAVSSGKWSVSPIVDEYQWEDCNASGKECTPILGATNQNYTPVSTDVGHTLVAEVTATDGGGSLLVPSAASAAVVSKAGLFTQTIDSGNSLNAMSCITGTTDCVSGDSQGKAYYATNVSVSTAASWSAWSGPGASPSEAVDCPATSLCLMAAGSDEGNGGNLYYASSLGGTWTQAYSPSYGVDAISCASTSFCVDGQDGDGYFRYATSPASTSWTLEDQGSYSMKGVSCVSSSFCAIADGDGNVHVATTTSQIESSSWTDTSVDGTTTLNGIACISTTSCLAVDTAGDVLSLAVESSGTAKATKHDIDGTNSITAIACTASETCVAVDNVGNIFVSKNNGSTWTEQYSLSDKLTSVSCVSATLCATGDTTGKVTAFNPAGGTTTSGELHAAEPGMTIDYNVPVSGTGQAYPMSASEVAKWSQTDAPYEAVAIFPPDSPQGWPASNYKRASVIYFDSSGRRVDVAAPGGAIAMTQYESHDNVERTLTPGNRLRALESTETAKEAELLETKNTYEDEGALLESSTGPQHEVKLANGTMTEARAHTVYAYDKGAPKSESPYDLVTKTTEGALLTTGKEEDVRTIEDSYSGQSNLGWELHKPTSVTTEPESGKQLTRTTVYSTETGDVVETKAPGSANKTGNSGAHDSQTIYYSASANGTYPECGKHPEWQGMPCLERPTEQPADGIDIPEAAYMYNTWGEIATNTETDGASKRTSTVTYDAAGRPKETSVSSPTGKAVPNITEKYSNETGASIEQSTTESGHTKSLISVFNTVGQLTSYTDAAGKTATFEYENEGDRRLVKSNDGKGTQTAVYNEAGAIKELTDSAAGTFSAEYDGEGQLSTETYPNGMKASFTYNSTGQATALAYTKGAATWYKDEVVPSIHGQWLSQVSTLTTKDTYTYDGIGRLTEVQETPSGKGCTAELYSYDYDSNRISETKRESGTGTCPTEGGTTETHSYDEGDHVIDSGVTYGPFGEDKTIPATDAGGHNLESSYYANGELYSQTQGEQTNTYILDPAGRVLETTTIKGIESKSTISNYSGEGSTATWTEEPTSGDWTRTINGIGGVLGAVQTSTGGVVLQLVNLHGDIVGTAPDNTTESATLTSEPTAFGVPTSTPASKYGWLGNAGFRTEFASGVISGSEGSYVPQLGTYLSPTGAGGSTLQDPVNEYLAGEAQAEPTSEGTATLPGAIEPLPVNTAIEKAYHAHPPYAQLPSNVGCNEEVQDCGEDPEFGDNTHGCHVWASWGDLSDGISNDIEVYGHFACTYASAVFELGVEFQLVLWGGVNGGTYKLERENHKDFPGSESKSGSESWNYECQPGKWYRLVVWGRYWYTNDYSPWHAYALDGRLEECSQEAAPAEPETW